MNTNREDLIERYQQFSDEELLKIFTSGNLTELAQSVALNEVKARRILAPKPDLKSNDKLPVNMSPVAFNLTSSEADELSEIIKNNGIPVLIDKVGNSEEPKSNKLYKLSVSPMHVAAAMGIINAHINYSADVDHDLVSNEELNTGIGNDVVKYNQNVGELNIGDDESNTVESKAESSNKRLQLLKLFLVIFALLIDWISRKLFDFSILEFIHFYK